MNLKCAYCDLTSKKSINTETDDYIKDDTNKYYHDNCYRAHWKNKKRNKKTEEEVDELIRGFKIQQEWAVREMHEKDKFLRWIMDYYNGTLSPYFLKKLQTVRDGEYQGLNEPINYDILLDIYDKMKVYLEKNATKKQFNNIGQRMNYDLAVVIGNYGDYKKYKEKMKQENIQRKEIEDNLKMTTSYKNEVKHDYIGNENEFNISDHINDLLL